jgi:hypothetical protein
MGVDGLTPNIGGETQVQRGAVLVVHASGQRRGAVAARAPVLFIHHRPCRFELLIGHHQLPECLIVIGEQLVVHTQIGRWFTKVKQQVVGECLGQIGRIGLIAGQAGQQAQLQGASGTERQVDIGLVENAVGQAAAFAAEAGPATPVRLDDQLHAGRFRAYAKGFLDIQVNITQIAVVVVVSPVLVEKAETGGIAVTVVQEHGVNKASYAQPGNRPGLRRFTQRVHLDLEAVDGLLQCFRLLAFGCRRRIGIASCSVVAAQLLLQVLYLLLERGIWALLCCSALTCCSSASSFCSKTALHRYLPCATGRAMMAMAISFFA